MRNVTWLLVVGRVLAGAPAAWACPAPGSVGAVNVQVEALDPMDFGAGAAVPPSNSYKVHLSWSAPTDFDCFTPDRTEWGSYVVSADAGDGLERSLTASLLDDPHEPVYDTVLAQSTVEELGTREWTFKVHATRGTAPQGGSGPTSSEKAFIPGPLNGPANAVGTRSDGTIRLSWSSPGARVGGAAGQQEPITGFEIVKVVEGSSGDTTEKKAASVTGTQWTDPNPGAGVAMYFLYAKDKYGVGKATSVLVDGDSTQPSTKGGCGGGGNAAATLVPALAFACCRGNRRRRGTGS